MVKFSDTIDNVKAKVSDFIVGAGGLSRVPIDQIHLLKPVEGGRDFGRFELAGRRTLFYYNIKRGDELDLVIGETDEDDDSS